MKNIRVTIISDYRFPDGWEIVPSAEVYESLSGEGQGFLPDICWLTVDPGTAAGESRIHHADVRPVDPARSLWFEEHLENQEITVGPL